MKRHLLAPVLAIWADVLSAQSGGRAELAFQGYYWRIGPQFTSATTGVGLKFEEFLPNVGLLRGNVEAYGTQDGIQPADNFLQLRGFVWKGLRWNITGGDFRESGTVLKNPFTNFFIPEIGARGVQVEAGDSKQGYSFFLGGVTLLAGPRIPFRVRAPQNVLGASAWRSLGKLNTGVRLLRFNNIERSPGEDIYFPAHRNFKTAGNATAFATYTVNDHLQWYGEATLARAETIGQRRAIQPFSYFFGPTWESPRFTVRANYANLSEAYFPLAGFWVGGRRGPFGEVRVRPSRRIELFAAASLYESTLSDDLGQKFKTSSVPVGASFSLPWKISGSTHLSKSAFTSVDPTTEVKQQSSNVQWITTLSRPIRRHALRTSFQDMRLDTNGVAGRLFVGTES